MQTLRVNSSISFKPNESCSTFCYTAFQKYLLCIELIFARMQTRYLAHINSSLPLSYLLNHNSILSNLNCMWDLTSNCEYFRAEKLFKCFKPGSKLPSTFQLLVLDIRRWNIKEKIAIQKLYQYQTLINSVMKYIWEIIMIKII